MDNECVESNWSVLTVRPRQPFLDWANGLPDAHPVTIEELCVDLEAYLVPASENPGAEEAALKRNFEAVFERQLEGVVSRSVDVAGEANAGRVPEVV